MPIFGDADHPSVSLRLHNMQRPINILTGTNKVVDGDLRTSGTNSGLGVDMTSQMSRR